MFSGTANSYSSGGDESIDDLWEWNGVVWTSIAMGATRPIDRHYGAFIYDPFHGVSVLFGGEERGGFGASDQIYGDHWTWNGDAWSTMPTESVGVRFVSNGAGALAVSEYGEQLSVGPDGIYQWRAGGGRTSAVLAFDWSRAAVPAYDIRGALLFVQAQNRGGPPTVDGSPTGGVEAAAWSWRSDRWVSTARGPVVGDNDVQLALPATGAQAASTIDDTILFRLRADHPAGTVPAGGIALDYAELTVEYWLGTPGVCGDGFVDAQEACDDGDTVASGNGCGTSCERLGGCGDETRQDLFEECDQGALNSDVAADACRSDCRRAHCGDGVRDAAEDCDDGNTVDDGDGCGGDCRWSDTCGDGRVTQNEECDDGNLINDQNGCLADCTLDPCCSTNPSGGCAPGGSAAIEACVEAIDASCTSDWTTTCVAEVLAFSCGVCDWTP
jgi:cysteine-rich repeat protein